MQSISLIRVDSNILLSVFVLRNPARRDKGSATYYHWHEKRPHLIERCKTIENECLKHPTTSIIHQKDLRSSPIIKLLPTMNMRYEYALWIYIVIQERMQKVSWLIGRNTRNYVFFTAYSIPRRDIIDVLLLNYMNTGYLPYIQTDMENR